MQLVYIKEAYPKYGIKANEIGELISQKDTQSTVKFINSNKEITLETNLIEIFDYDNTGDESEYKICNMCNRLLPVDNFDKNQTGKGDRVVRRPSCKECRKIIDGKNVSAKKKKECEKTKPNLIVWECPICKKRTIPGLTSKVVLDHNHTTGEPRAWICDSCNTGLGRFKDDPEVLANAIQYLKNQNKEP